MAAPRVFISSTYYDLKHVRDDIEIFLRGLGYFPVMHDKGSITYTQGNTSLEQSCYNELTTCDIVICIIGGKYGTQASGSDYSITMEELQEAIRKRKKIYVYILKDVNSENFTYKRNVGNKNFVPYHVDDIRVHTFISDMRETVKNAPIIPFESVSDITSNLQQQLAGLFQYLLAQDATITEGKTYADLQGAAKKIEDLVNSLNCEQKALFQKFDSSMFAVKYPIRRILKLLNIQYFSVFISNKNGIVEFLKMNGYRLIDDGQVVEGFLVFEQNDGACIRKLILNLLLFDKEDVLKDIREHETVEEYIKFEEIENNFPNFNTKDDLPF